MKRTASVSPSRTGNKRPCTQPATRDECYSGSFPTQHLQPEMIATSTDMRLCAVQPATAAALGHVLEVTLNEADAALHLTMHAMSLAAHIYECGSPDAADRALSIAEQALAATVQRLTRAQLLVSHQLKAQHMNAALHQVAEVDDIELQDTCSSGLSCSKSGLSCSLWPAVSD